LKKRIFIIEDDTITAHFISTMLLKLNFDVAGITDNSIDAFKKIKETRPDLILVDIDLNDSISGIDIVRKINKLYNIPVLYVTGHADFEIIESARETNPYGYVLKPVTTIALYSAIDSALNQHRIKKERDIAQENFRHIFELSNDIIIVLDVNGYIIEVNPIIFEKTCYAKDELINQRLIEFFHPDDKKKTEIIEDKLVRKRKQIIQYVNRFIKKDGSILWLEWSAKPVPGKNIFYLIARDITKKVKNTKTLQLNEARLSSLVELSRMSEKQLNEITDYALHVSIDLTESKIGYIAFVSEDEKTMTMHSWSQEAMNLCRINDKPVEYRINKTGLWGEAVRQRSPIITNDYKSHSSLKKGYPKGHIEIKNHMNVPIFDGDQIVIVAGVGNKTDDYDELDVNQLTLIMDGLWKIIKHKSIVDELSKSEKKFKDLVESLNDIIFTLDTSGTIDYISSSVRSVLGYHPEDYIGRKLIDFIHPDDLSDVVKYISDKSDDLHHEIEFRFKDIKKRYKYIKASIKLNRLSDNAVEITGLMTDITENREAEQEIIRLNKHIFDIQEKERQSISRDLHDSVGQTIIAAKLNIEMYLNNNELFGDKLNVALTFIDKASQELREIYSNLFPSILSDLGLPATIRWYVKNVFLANSIDATVEIKINEKLESKIKINLYRIIQEIFSNIIKHSGAKKVKVILERKNGNLILNVHDDGIGISEIQKFKGGYGLTNIKYRAESINGEYQIISKPDNGTQIIIKVKSENEK
jgi:PAS domain S-box-containing protein